MEEQKSPFQYEKNTEYDDAHYSHLLAEQLPADYAYHRFRQLSTQKSPSGWYRSAFSHIELALCESAKLDDDIRASYINDCNFLLTKPMGLQNEKTTDALRLNAAIACSYLNVFKKRSLQQEITQLDCSDLYKSLGSALTMSRAFAYNPEALESRLAEGIAPALGARTMQPHNIIFPSSPREEGSPNQPSNHDGYFINEQHQKVRVQTKIIKTHKLYEHPTIIVTIEGILNHISKKNAKKFINSMTILDINGLIDMIARESSGLDITVQEKYELDVATAYLIKPLVQLQRAA